MAKITQNFRRGALGRGVIVKTNKACDIPAHVLIATDSPTLDTCNRGSSVRKIGLALSTNSRNRV